MSELEGEYNKWITTRANDKAEISTLEGKDAAVKHDNLLSLTQENSLTIVIAMMPMSPGSSHNAVKWEEWSGPTQWRDD